MDLSHIQERFKLVGIRVIPGLPQSIKCIVPLAALPSQGLLNFPGHSQNVFSQLAGFSNWKKALQKFGEHEASSMHREANLKLLAKSQVLVYMLNSQLSIASCIGNTGLCS